MIVCMKCGFHNTDGAEFCARCGTFLEWDGEKVEAAAAEPVMDDPPVVVERSRLGWLGRIKKSIGIGDGGDGSS